MIRDIANLKETPTWTLKTLPGPLSVAQPEGRRFQRCQSKGAAAGGPRGCGGTIPGRSPRWGHVRFGFCLFFFLIYKSQSVYTPDLCNATAVQGFPPHVSLVPAAGTAGTRATFLGCRTQVAPTMKEMNLQFSFLYAAPPINGATPATAGILYHRGQRCLQEARGHFFFFRQWLDNPKIHLMVLNLDT